MLIVVIAFCCTAYGHPTLFGSRVKKYRLRARPRRETRETIALHARTICFRWQLESRTEETLVKTSHERAVIATTLGGKSYYFFRRKTCIVSGRHWRRTIQWRHVHGRVIFTVFNFTDVCRSGEMIFSVSHSTAGSWRDNQTLKNDNPKLRNARSFPFTVPVHERTKLEKKRTVPPDAVMLVCEQRKNDLPEDAWRTQLRKIRRTRNDCDVSRIHGHRG